MLIRALTDSDLAEWRRMRDALWPGQTAEDMRAWRGRSDTVVLVAERPDGRLGGFAELGERSIADGCESSPVAYLEGWWVDADLRRGGIGTALIRAGEEWARNRGYTELASDTETANAVSQMAHERLGFLEAGRAVLYRKVL